MNDDKNVLNLAAMTERVRIAEIDAAIQASRAELAAYDHKCGCWQRVPVNPEYVGRVLWHLCDYHDGYEDGLRKASEMS